MNIQFKYAEGPDVLKDRSQTDLLSRCSALYSSHYGVWSSVQPENSHNTPGEHVKLSAVRLAQWLSSKNSSLYYAEYEGNLIGYAIDIRIDQPDYGLISWVTQLVVHKDYRNLRIAKNLLHAIWGFTNMHAYGIVSASPYAIRALEKTTRRRSNPEAIKSNLEHILKAAEGSIPYIDKDTQSDVTNCISQLNTSFYVNHSNIEEMLAQVTSVDVEWTLCTN